MSYTKQNFTDGQTLKASHLNHMEDGIEAAIEQVASAVAEYLASGIPVTDRTTGTNYMLYVDDGKLTMEEV